jgi:hypothetical protein
LSALGVFFFFFVAFKRLFEVLDPFANALSHFGQPLGAKQEEDNDEQDYKFRQA